MGYSTWNDCSSFRDNGPNGWCWNSEEHVRNVTQYMLSSGLFALGYDHINVDEGWLKGRNAAGEMYEDLSKFPSGMAGLGQWVHSQGMKYGLYSCRGTCQCGTGTYNAPGSHGYEAADVDWMVAAGADYLKIDSCCGDQTHSVAFSDYAKFRDAMNATGKRVWFSLCGWEEWYSPPDPSINYAGGASLGNSWRIAGDGSGWGPLTNCMNVIAAVSNYSGQFGWADPDLLIGPEVYVGGQTDEQARAQFTMWSLFPANLLISQNVLAWSPYALETYSNAEAIAINQDSLGSPAFRVVGGDLAFPCAGGSAGAVAGVKAAPCNAGDALQQWNFDAASGVISLRGNASWVLDAVDCGTGDGTPVAVYTPDGNGGACGGENQRWTAHADGTLTNGHSGACLDVFNWQGPAVDTWTCNGGSNQNFTWTSGNGLLATADGGAGKPSMCIAADPDAAAACTNVWGRVLSDGFAVGMVNNAAVALPVTCDAACFAKVGLAGGAYNVRDTWAHAAVAKISPPYSFTATVNGSGFASLFKLTPA